MLLTTTGQIIKTQYQEAYDLRLHQLVLCTQKNGKKMALRKMPLSEHVDG